MISFIGHKEQFRNLLQMKQNKRVPHGLLFAGPISIGKKRVALRFAQALICEKSDNGCGVCGVCKRIEAQQSESLYVLEPTGTTHKIEAIREVIRWASLQTVGHARVIIVDDAHVMTPQAANALLKIVEAPPEGTYFIFITPSRERVIATLRSRLQTVKFKMLSRAEMAQINGPEDEEKVEFRNQAAQLLLDHLNGQNITEPLRGSLTDRESAKMMLHFWLRFTRDGWVAAKTSADVLHPEHQDLLKRLMELSETQLSDLAEQFFALDKALQQNADYQLAFEAAMK